MTETDKIILIDEAAVFMARLWKKIGAPVSYERSTIVDGVLVRVTVDYGEQAMQEAAKPKLDSGDERTE